MKYVESPAVRCYVGHESIVSPTSVNLIDIPVEVDSETLSGEQTIHIGVAEGSPEPKGVLLVPVSWSDSCSRDFHANRLGTLAKFTGLRVIGIDYPGMGDIDGGRNLELTEKQIEDAKNGRMQNLSETYWKALQSQNLLNGSSDETLSIAFWGHSLASFTVAEMAATTPDGHEITDIHFSEIMALKKEFPLSFALRFANKGMYDLGLYLDMNAGMPEYSSSGTLGLLKQVATQPQSHLRSFQTLTKGRHQEVVKSAYENGRISTSHDSGTKLTIVSADKGLVATKALSGFIKYIRRPFNDKTFNPNIEVRTLFDTGHGYQDALPAVLREATSLTIVEAFK